MYQPDASPFCQTSASSEQCGPQKNARSPSELELAGETSPTCMNSMYTWPSSSSLKVQAPRGPCRSWRMPGSHWRTCIIHPVVETPMQTRPSKQRWASRCTGLCPCNLVAAADGYLSTGQVEGSFCQRALGAFSRARVRNDPSPFFIANCDVMPRSRLTSPRSGQLPLLSSSTLVPDVEAEWNHAESRTVCARWKTLLRSAANRSAHR